MADIQQNFEKQAGENKTVRFTLSDADGARLILTGRTVRWIMKRHPTSAAYLITKQTGGQGVTVASVSPAEDGLIDVAIDGDDDEDLAGVFCHEAHVSDAESPEGWIVVALGDVTIHPSGLSSFP
jgi:hypothetical protein